jgi:hypothetical protein
LPCEDVVDAAWIATAQTLRDAGYPKDAWFWDHSLPLVRVGDGSYLGVYCKEEQDDQPVAYLCHEGCGASGIIAPGFDEFLTQWEQLGYVGVHFLQSFIDRQSRLLAAGAERRGG